MKIEKVRVKTTLKAGKDVWQKGLILTEPLPKDILNEIYCDTGTVEILEQGQDMSNKPVLVSKGKLKEATTTTTVEETVMATTTTPPPKAELKPKLKAKAKLKPKKRKIVKRKKK
jgi:hypothetical protein